MIRNKIPSVYRTTQNSRHFETYNSKPQLFDLSYNKIDESMQVGAGYNESC